MFMEEETVGVMLPGSSVDAVNSIGANKFPSLIRVITERVAVLIGYGNEIICSSWSDIAIAAVSLGESISPVSFHIIDSDWNWDRARICTDGLFKTFVICIGDLSAYLIAYIKSRDGVCGVAVTNILPAIVVRRGLPLIRISTI